MTHYYASETGFDEIFPLVVFPMGGPHLRRSGRFLRRNTGSRTLGPTSPMTPESVPPTYRRNPGPGGRVVELTGDTVASHFRPPYLCCDHLLWWAGVRRGW